MNRDLRRAERDQQAQTARNNACLRAHREVVYMYSQYRWDAIRSDNEDRTAKIQEAEQMIDEYTRVIAELEEKNRLLAVKVDELRSEQYWRKYIRAPPSPMTGTDRFWRECANNHSVAGRAMNNIGEWMAFAVATMNIPMILMETNAIEAHIVLAFAARGVRRLPRDISTMVSGYAVDACARTRYRFNHMRIYDLTPEEIAQWRVAYEYVRPANHCRRRMYVANWKAQ